MDVKPSAVSLSDRLRAVIDATGLQDKEVAYRAGIPQSSLSRLKNQVDPDPRLSTLIPIARTLGISIDELVADDGPVPVATLGRYDNPIYRPVIDSLAELSDRDRKTVVEFLGWLSSAVTRRVVPMQRFGDGGEERDDPITPGENDRMAIDKPGNTTDYDREGTTGRDEALAESPGRNKRRKKDRPS